MRVENVFLKVFMAVEQNIILYKYVFISCLDVEADFLLVEK